MQLREAKLTITFIGVAALLLQFGVATKSLVPKLSLAHH
jgi:hypothetical protein